jgi:hypothetical protein
VLVEDPAGNPIELFEPASGSAASAIPPDERVLTPFLSIDGR